MFYENSINNKADDYAKATLKSLPTSNTNKFKQKELFELLLPESLILSDIIFYIQYLLLMDMHKWDWI